MSEIVSDAKSDAKEAALDWIYEGHEGDTLIAAPGEQVINITNVTARRKVSGYVGSRISYMMGGETPALVFSQGRLLWRVPIVMTTPSQGIIGVVGTLDVDARTGLLLIPSPSKLEAQVIARAQALLGDSTSSSAT
jgi:hypothetical protein